jgi:cytidylate kinase
MTERISAYPDGPFHQFVRENCESKEISGKNIAVLAIGGTEGAGLTTTGRMIEEIASQQEHLKVHFYSAGEEMEKKRKSMTDSHNSIGYFRRDATVDRSVNLDIASHMIDPANKDSLVIVEGRLAPYIAKQLQFASDDLQLPIPAEIVTVYLTTRDRKMGYMRKYLNALKEDPTLDDNEFYAQMEEKNRLDLDAFWKAYPELQGTTPYSFNFQIRGKGVYDLRYDTAAYNEEDIALQIMTEPKVERLLSILPQNETL